MTYQKERQWAILEQLLPMLKNSIRLEAERRKYKEEFKQKYPRLIGEPIRLLKQRKEIKEELSVAKRQGFESIESMLSLMARAEQLEREVEDVFVASEKLVEVQERIEQLNKELSMDYKYYEDCYMLLKGIRIKKGQVSIDEFESLLYFIHVTGADPTELFENFAGMYPHITESWNRRCQKI